MLDNSHAEARRARTPGHRPADARHDRAGLSLPTIQRLEASEGTENGNVGKTRNGPLETKSCCVFTPKLGAVLREGYRLGDLRADTILGLTVAIVAVLHTYEPKRTPDAKSVRP